MVIRSNGLTTGALNEWNPRINRTLTDLYEFGPVTGPFAHNPGEPFEVVPGNVSGMQIDVRRWDLYTDQIETIFTGVAQDITMLSNQFDSFGLREVWTTPGALNNFVRIYSGVWWQDTSRTIDAKGDRTVNAGGTLRYTRRDKISV
jgi:hypothetical protein